MKGGGRAIERILAQCLTAGGGERRRKRGRRRQRGRRRRKADLAKGGGEIES